MTQQEMEAMQAELQARFPGLETRTSFDLQADYNTRSFKEQARISIWNNGECVCVLLSQKHFEALINVARIMSQGQLETIGTHQGQCIECERVSIVSDASHLCEACTLEAQIGNDGQWEFKPLA